MSSPACLYAAQKCQRGDDDGDLSDRALLARCKQAINECSVDRSKLANGYDIQTCMNVSQLALCGNRGASGEPNTACYDLESIPTTGASPNEVRYWDEKGGVIIDGDPYDSIAVSCRTCTDANPDASMVHAVANYEMDLTATMCCDEDSLKNMISTVPAFCDVIVKNATLTCGLDDAVKVCKNKDIAAMCNWTTINDHDVYTECSDQIPKQTDPDRWYSEGVPVGWYAGIGAGVAVGGVGLTAYVGRRGANEMRGGLNRLQNNLRAYNDAADAASNARVRDAAEAGRETMTLLAGGEQAEYGSGSETVQVPVSQVLSGTGGRNVDMGGAYELQDFSAPGQVEENPVHNFAAGGAAYPDDYDETGE